MKINTSFEYPPIGTRAFDWSAVTDNYDGSPDCNDPIGRGATDQEAIADLMAQLEDEADDARQKALDIAQSDLSRIMRARDDLQATWEQNATDIVAERLTEIEADKLDYSALLAGITDALNGHFWELIDTAEQAVRTAENAIEDAENDAADAAEIAALEVARRAA